MASEGATAAIRDILDRAQMAFESTVNPHVEPEVARESVAWFIHHVTTAVLLEHIRRLEPTTADRLVPWLLAQDGIFSDGYAGELLHGWREQLANGLQLEPIGPESVPGSSGEVQGG